MRPLLLGLAEASLGSDEQRERGEAAIELLYTQRARRRQQQPTLAARGGEVALESRWAGHFGHAVAPALLAGAHHDRAPVPQPVLDLMLVETHDGALGDERDDAAHAELGGLLHHPVH